MNFNNIQKEIIAAISSVLVICLIVASLPAGDSGSSSEELSLEYYNMQTSAGASASISSADSSTTAGASGAVSGETVGVVDVNNDLVGQPSDGEGSEDTSKESEVNTES